MILEQIGIGMAGKRRVGAIPEAHIGLGERHGHGHDERIGANVTGLAAIDEAYAADII